MLRMEMEHLRSMHSIMLANQPPLHPHLPMLPHQPPQPPMMGLMDGAGHKGLQQQQPQPQPQPQPQQQQNQQQLAKGAPPGFGSLQHPGV